MSTIFDSANFIVRIPEKPHVDRADGGHIIIDPKIPWEDRTQLSLPLGIELDRLTTMMGEAMREALNQRGVDVARINYQENGNWRQELHVHLYGRARSAKWQPYGHALHFPHPSEQPEFYEGLHPLTAEDIDAIREEIKRLIVTDKYRNFLMPTNM